MNISEKTLSTLEFDRIRELLADCAPTEGSRAMALTLQPTNDIGRVLRRQRRTSDARRFADEKGAPSFGGVVDVSAACERAEKGAILEGRFLSVLLVPVKNK